MDKLALLLGAELEIKEVSYPSTKELTAPFIKIINPFITGEPRIRVKHPDFKVFDNEGRSVVGYTRVNIEYDVKDTEAPAGYRKVIGLSYALDVKSPISKIYVGYRTKEDVLIISNPDLIIRDLIEADSAIQVGSSVLNLLESATNINTFDDKLDETFDVKKVCSSWGFWLVRIIEHGIEEETYKVKLSSTQISKAVKAILTDHKSEYYMGTGSISLYDIFIAVSKVVMDEDKDVITEFEKAVLIARMLGL